MNKNKRRDFIRKSLLGASAAAFLPVTMKNNPVKPKSSVVELPARTLGRTGIKTSLISFGTAGINDTGLIKAAYNAGIRTFFSATYYGEGNNERILGEGLKNLPRDSFIVGTAIPEEKVDRRSGLFTTPFDVDAYIKKADACLERFGMDHVDFLLFPYASKRETVMNESLIKALEQLKKQGKTRFVGIASHGGTEEALKAAADAGIYDVAMISCNFMITNKESLDKAIEYSVKKGMGIIAMKTISGAMRSKGGTAINTTAALKWVLQNENISTVVSGMTTFDHLEKNLPLLRDIKMTEQEKTDLGVAAAEKEYGLYCQQCRECLPQCPYNLDIPTIMRSYMYAYGYKNLEQARCTLSEADLKENPCSHCEECRVKCTSGFDIKGKVTDISRLKDIPEDLMINQSVRNALA